MMQDPSSRPATADEQADAILAQIHKPQVAAAPVPEPVDNTPVPGLAEADTALKLVLDRRATIRTRLAEAEGAIVMATRDRAALVARTTAGDVVPASESRANQEALSAIEGDLGLLRDSLPGAEADIQRAEERVARVLRAEAGRLETSAVQVHQAAKEALIVAQGREHRAAEALVAARQRSASAGNRGYWNGRVSAAPTACDETDILSASGWDRFTRDQTARTGATVDYVKQRHALADAILADARRRETAG
jgi:hypothetical protein